MHIVLYLKIIQKSDKFEFLVGTKSGEIGAECFEPIGTFLTRRRKI